MEGMIIPSVHPSPVIHIDNSRTARDFLRRAIEPYNPSDVYHLIQRDTSGKVDKCEHGMQIARPPDHLLVSVLEADSGSTHEESKSGAGIGQRDGYGFGGRDDAENLWCVGDLELEDSTIREVVELEQEVH